MWIYFQSEPELWTVGFYKPNGTFMTESDYNHKNEAAARCNYLNGGATGEEA